MTQIDIVLTDFGLAGANSQGGTPVFGSPECFETKGHKSDVFSFGRVILFLLVTKEQFIKWLFVPIQDSSVLQNISCTSGAIELVKQMTSMTNRIDLQRAREIFNELRSNSKIKPTHDAISFDLIADSNLKNLKGYISELGDLRLVISRVSLTRGNMKFPKKL